jgi:transposase-like protein
MLLLTPSVSGLFKWRQFEPEVILLAVGWYLRFSLSYRDMEELLAGRGLLVDHVTVWRWVQRYAPEMERRYPSYRLHGNPVGGCRLQLNRIARRLETDFSFKS